MDIYVLEGDPLESEGHLNLFFSAKINKVKAGTLLSAENAF